MTPMSQSRSERAVNQPLLAGAALCASGIAYLLYRHLSDADGAGGGERLVFGMAFGALGMFLLFAMRFQSEAKLNILLLLAAANERESLD